jgi:two-component system, NtrC family, sensor kinase
LVYSGRGDNLRLKFYGLRTGILAQLLFLIIAAMLLVNVTMLNLSQRHLLQCKADAGKLLIRALSLNIGHRLENSTKPLSSVFEDKEIAEQIKGLLSDGGYPHLVLTNSNGDASFTTHPSEEDAGTLLSLSRISIRETEMAVNYRGNAWGVFWLGRQEIAVSGPLMYRGRVIGGAAAGSPLISVYRSLRESERLILLYIILDTMVLGLVGIYLLSRIVVNPIHRLLKITDKYMEGDILPAMPESTSGNEIGSLSRSLNVMLQRLNENKHELKEHISSLEKANTELKLAQNEIIRSEKLASVGRLAAGLAHEIGNPLGIILGYLDLIRKADINEEDKKDFLSRIETEITRINRIIRQLLDFSRPSTGSNVDRNIHDVISDTVNMLRPYPLMEDINIILDLKAKRDMAFSDPSQLQQVFLNILMNSADVLNEGSHAYKDTSKKIVITTENKGDYIEIRFIDNGPGIDDSKIERIFDPFFTTKDPGKGTGLGLYVSYVIIEAQGGKIRAESAKDEGMSIIINLPIHDDPTQGVA